MIRPLALLMPLLPLVLFSAGKPNTLLICVDDLKPVLGCYGDPHAKTPHLDGLSARGLRFDRAYCNQAVCSPPEGAPSFAPQFGGELRRYKDMPPGKAPLGDKLTRHLIHGYYAATSYTDACAGQVLDALVANDLAENTIVILWGDHGWHLGDHGMWCKHTNYEQAAPEGLDGESFAALLEDPASRHRDHAIHVCPRNNLLGRAIRTDRHRLVEWKKPGAASGTAIFELYDYVEDPKETDNLTSDRPENVAELKKLLATHPEAKPQISAKARPAAKSKAKGKEKS